MAGCHRRAALVVLLTFTAHRARAADAPMSPNPSQPGQHRINLTGTPLPLPPWPPAVRKVVDPMCNLIRRAVMVTLI